jgi:hypothetical protein
MRIKKLIIGLGLIVLSGCSSLDRFMVDDFDNVEFGKLAELRVISNFGATCHPGEIKRLVYSSRVLKQYSKNTLNANISSIYDEINSLSEELYARENPSAGYCKIKRRNITMAIDAALETFGGRVK